MDVILLSRIQFTVTAVYHFLFVPLTIGLGLYVAIFETLGYVKKSEKYYKLARFFGKLFVISFAVGVVTGIVQEFEFGMNWSDYSRYVGDVFGAPLAIEALSAFFLESVFLGVWIFGRDRLSKRIQLISIWLVAIASNISAYWILVANSFMQDPTGYKIENGRAVMTSFWALISNEHVVLQYLHTVMASVVTAACFIIGVSAYQLLKKKYPDIFSRSFKLAAVTCLIAVIGVAVIGDLQGKYMAENQPMKLAAAEALWDTEDNAGLSIIAGIDEADQKNSFSIEVPGLLSFMATGTFGSTIEGIHQLQEEFVSTYGEGNYIPPVTLTFWSFRIMIGLAGIMLLICLIAIFKFRREKYLDSKWLLKLSLIMIPIPFLANTAGWVVTEVGRQPWIVYGLLTLEQSFSKSVSSTSVLLSLIGFTLIYTIIAVITVVLIAKTIKKERWE